MKNHRLILRAADRYILDQIAEGLKTVETRAATPKYRKVEAGDTLTIVCGNDFVVKKVVNAKVFDSLESLYSHYQVNNVLPSATDIVQARNIHFSFRGYKQKIEAYGIVAFELE